jgi:hypothetical protein
MSDNEEEAILSKIKDWWKGNQDPQRNYPIKRDLIVKFLKKFFILRNGFTYSAPINCL